MNRPRRARASAAILVASLLVGPACVRALRPVTPLPDLETTSTGRADIDDAERLWSTRDPDQVRRAAEAFETRLASPTSDDGRFEAVVGAVDAWVWLARNHPEEEARKDAATRAVRAAQWCEIVRPELRDAECAYWLGAALGIQAQQRRATALDGLPRVVERFDTASRNVPEYRFAGPDRALALLLVRAPGFPIGPGDPEESLERARAAVGRFPDHAPNQAALGEALEALGRGDEAREAWSRALQNARRAALEGNPDGDAWIDDAREALARLGSSP